MKKTFFLIILFSLMLAPAFQAHCQNLSTTDPTTAVFEISRGAQFLKDLRRWEIVAFGSFPFALFNVTFIADMIRWNDANRFDISEEGRRYAPWPLKSAGAVEMSSNELGRTILIAAGVSVLVASIDIAIVLIKRNQERKRIDSLPSGSVTIERILPGDEEPGGNE